VDVDLRNDPDLSASNAAWSRTERRCGEGHHLRARPSSSTAGGETRVPSRATRCPSRLLILVERQRRYSEIGERRASPPEVSCPVPSRSLRECRLSGLRPLLGLNLRGKILPRSHPATVVSSSSGMRPSALHQHSAGARKKRRASDVSTSPATGGAGRGVTSMNQQWPVLIKIAQTPRHEIGHPCLSFRGARICFHLPNAEHVPKRNWHRPNATTGIASGSLLPLKLGSFSPARGFAHKVSLRESFLCKI
jgi:hypothetical protein